MTTQGALNSISASIGSNTTNGAFATYTVSISTSIPLANGDILYLTFPTDVSLSSTSTSCSTNT